MGCELVMVHYVYMCLYEGGWDFDGVVVQLMIQLVYRQELIIASHRGPTLSKASCETWIFAILETRPGKKPFDIGSFSKFQAVTGCTISEWLFPFSLFQLVDIRLAPQPLHLPPRGAHTASHAV